MDGFVTRSEFELYCRQQNGSLQRIEKAQDEILQEIKELRSELSEKVPWDTYTDDRRGYNDKLERLSGRPSWLTAAFITFLSSVTVGMLTALIALTVR